MRFTFFKNTFFFLLLFGIACAGTDKPQPARDGLKEEAAILTGAQQMDLYLDRLQGQKIALVGNQTTVVTDRQGGLVHLVDTLLSRNIDLVRVFAPEHGFRGDLDAGEAVQDGVDTRTGLPVISLYGKNKKPAPEQLEGVDLVVFDIQDVGARFYTYISTLHYVMEACAEMNIPVLVLDRPNPNGHYMDGPILEEAHQSFVGMHPVPVVYGMTIGEYARMINGAGWLDNAIQSDLTVVPLANYDRTDLYDLPVKPSPNLPNAQSINLYPSLCFFEGTPVSAGRGTQTQFQVFGAPFLPSNRYNYSFTPTSNPGAKYPKFEGELCQGLDLRDNPRLEHIKLSWLLEAYRSTEKKNEFFSAFFVKLAGTEKLQEQIEAGQTEQEIRESWEAELASFAAFRKPYLLYPE